MKQHNIIHITYIYNLNKALHFYLSNTQHTAPSRDNNRTNF